VTTCWRRFAEWAHAGVFERLQELLLDELGQAGALDWYRVSMDSFSIARCGIESSDRLGRHRWKAERTIAWPAGCRRCASATTVVPSSCSCCSLATSCATTGCAAQPTPDHQDPGSGASARWWADQLGLVLLDLIAATLVPAGVPLVLAVDDTLWLPHRPTAARRRRAPLLVSHGVLGCHVDTVDSWWANLPGPGFRVIGPSRFGYFASTLPKDATPADQADAYALLLDHLEVDRAVVIGFSAGSGSILELARCHPQRVIGLILACCRLGGGITFSNAFAPLFRLAYSADRLFWIFKRLSPTAYSRMMGMPKGYKASPEEADAVAAGMNLLFPLKPRREGAVFDGFVSNLAADRFPFEEIGVPTLVINARDDTFAPYRFAAAAANRIPGAKLVSIESGGHWFLGHDAEVRDAIGAFVRKVI